MAALLGVLSSRFTRVAACIRISRPRAHMGHILFFHSSGKRGGFCLQRRDFMTHQYLSNVYCVQGMMLLGKKGSFSFFFFWITRGSPALRFLRGFLVAVSVGRLSGRVLERPPWRPGLRAPSHGALGEILSSGLRHVFVRNSTDDRMGSSSLAVG